MSTTTFTIESVHGVKQTFVLGPDTNQGQRDSESGVTVQAEPSAGADDRVAPRRQVR